MKIKFVLKKIFFLSIEKKNTVTSASLTKTATTTVYSPGKQAQGLLLTNSVTL